jgi:hypothetical protein
VTAHHHPQPGGEPSGKRLLGVRNAALTAWMRRPLPVATAHTTTLLRAAAAQPAGVRTVAQFIARLPRALARRRAPHPVVEEALARLARAEREAGYATDQIGPGPGAIGSTVGTRRGARTQA